MRRFSVAGVIFSAVVSSTAVAQINSEGKAKTETQALLTENEARARIEAGGYAAVSTLQKNDKGMWRGTAYKNGQKLRVDVNRNGEVSSR